MLFKLADDLVTNPFSGLSWDLFSGAESSGCLVVSLVVGEFLSFIDVGSTNLFSSSLYKQEYHQY